MYSDAVELEIARIKRCDDPKELMTFVNSSYDVNIMRAAANRCYDLLMTTRTDSAYDQFVGRTKR